MLASNQLETLQAALADYRAAQAEVERIIREAGPASDAGRLELEEAMKVAMAAGARMSATFQKMKH